MPHDQASGTYYEVHGQGTPLLLGFPILASHAQVFGEAAGPIRDGFLERLTDRYRVLLMDYPSIGRSRDIAPELLTADRVCADLLSVASAAGFGGFIYWGYSWGAAAGLQLASRSDRLLGLVIGGWPPLGAQYADVLAAVEEQMDDPPPEVQVVLRSSAQYAQWAAFYRSIDTWPEERAARSTACPRLAFAGADGDVYAGTRLIRNASILRARKEELEAMGWRVELIPGKGHSVGLEPETVVPVVRAFLDSEFPDD
ncbi:MAG: alpha/beta hydrolase [Lysobacterales bacterium]|nr:MAG: alpha/beta hydrolase [Xanthomonadales bacterium]